MADNAYHFITHWRVQGTIQEVYDLLGDAPGLVRWWPSVYLDAKVVEPGDAHGIGRVIDLYTKGWLPYTLRWQFRVTELDAPRHIRLEAWGDFVGRGIWTLAQDGRWVNITYDWQISAEKPLLRTLSPLMKPIFSANHHWAMEKGEASLKLELARRHARNERELARIPPPPPPTTDSPIPLLLGTLGVLFALNWVWSHLSPNARRNLFLAALVGWVVKLYQERQGNKTSLNQLEKGLHAD